MHDPPAHPRLGRWLIGLWVLVQIGLLGWGAATGDWRWDMFSSTSLRDRRVVAEARIHEGPWEPLPVDTLFHYRRGGTDRTVLDEARALRGQRGGRRERARFAQWAVDELAPDWGYTEVRLRIESIHVQTLDVRDIDLGTFGVVD